MATPNETQVLAATLLVGVSRDFSSLLHASVGEYLPKNWPHRHFGYKKNLRKK